MIERDEEAARCPGFCLLIYDFDFENIVEKYELGAREDINEKMYFASVDTPHNVQCDRNVYSSEYDVITLEDMTDMVKMLGDVMNAVAHPHVFCSSLRVALRYNALVSPFTEERTRITSHCKDTGSESEKGETAVKQPVLEMEITALHYTRSAGGY